jgi:outer membrane protein TolC
LISQSMTFPSRSRWGGRGDRTRGRRLAAALLVGGGLTQLPSFAAQLDLDQAVALALAKNPALAAVEETRRQVEAGIKEARADAFPQFAVVSSWGQSRNPSLLNSPDFEEILNQFPGGDFEPSTQELTRAVVEVVQPVWTFGKVGAAIELAEIVADVADARIRIARLDTASDAAVAYYGVLAAREGLATLEAEREFRRRDLERVASLLEIGEATELERLRAAAALAEVEPEVARRQGEVVVAETRLRQVLALPADEPLELAPATRALPAPRELATLTAVALDQRPELQDLALTESTYHQRKRITKAETLPRLDLNASWGREVRLIENVTDPLYNAWSFSLDLRWEFFDGGRRKAQIARLESERTQLALQRTDLEARIRLETGRALSDYLTARSRAAASEAAAAASGEALRVARESYEQGVATQTDLLDAQSRATTADVVAVESFYTALIEAARLARALGQVPAADWSGLVENATP